MDPSQQLETAGLQVGLQVQVQGLQLLLSNWGSVLWAAIQVACKGVVIPRSS